MRYAYPAVFTPETNGYSVVFPDLEGCYTCGDSMQDALYMAEDVLAFTLFDYEKSGREIPEPGEPGRIKPDDGSFVNYVACDTIDYQRKHNNQAVKKTLSIPEWLNEIAVARGINFSQILQDALKSELGLLYIE